MKNAELDSLKIQVKLLETELEISRMRAESSEEECRQLKATIRNSAKLTAVEHLSAPVPPPPPPPPPPLPDFTKTNSSLSNIPQTFNDAITDAQQKLQQTDESKLSRKATGIKINFPSTLPSVVCERGASLSKLLTYFPLCLLI